MSSNRYIVFDDTPIYDQISNTDMYMSNIWVAWITSFLQTLSGYLSQYGMFVPRLTTSQRDEIQSPQLGQLIYNTSTNELQVWQVKSPAAASWHVITTTP